MVCEGALPSKVALDSPGVSLKSVHYEEIIQHKPPVPWFEVHPENLKSGSAFSYVERIRQDYPLSLHSVGLSLGSAEFNEEFLSFLSMLIARLSPSLFSGHVAWNYCEGIYIDDLLPLPYDDETMQVLVDNIQKTQDVLQQKILIENPSSYIKFEHTVYDECDFLLQVAKKAGCGVLLDLNNLYVGYRNGGPDPKPYIQKMISSGVVGEIHLGGHDVFEMTTGESVFLDTHSTKISEAVWGLFDFSLSLSGCTIPTLIEWDQNLPTLEGLLAERKKASTYMAHHDASQTVTASL